MAIGKCASCGSDSGCSHLDASQVSKEVEPHAGVVVSAHRENQSDPVPAPYVPAQPRREVRSSGGKQSDRLVYGPQGDPGPQGKQGPEGRPGRDGRDGSITEAIQAAENHMQTWLNATLKTAVSNAIKELGDLRGPAGKDGANSTLAGPCGAPGRDGSDGRSIIGPAGRDGKDGRNGLDANVEDVVRLSEDHMRQWLNNTLDAAVKAEIRSLGNLKGERGPVGERGSAGARGPAGDISSATENARDAAREELAAFRREIATLRKEVESLKGARQ